MTNPRQMRCQARKLHRHGIQPIVLIGDAGGPPAGDLVFLRIMWRYRSELAPAAVAVLSSRRLAVAYRPRAPMGDRARRCRNRCLDGGDIRQPDGTRDTDRVDLRRCHGPGLRGLAQRGHRGRTGDGATATGVDLRRVAAGYPMVDASTPPRPGPRCGGSLSRSSRPVWLTGRRRRGARGKCLRVVRRHREPGALGQQLACAGRKFRADLYGEAQVGRMTGQFLQALSDQCGGLDAFTATLRDARAEKGEFRPGPARPGPGSRLAGRAARLRGRLPGRV